MVDRRITEADRELILSLHAQGWDAKRITAYLKGTDHELEDWAVAMVIKARLYRNK